MNQSITTPYREVSNIDQVNNSSDPLKAIPSKGGFIREDITYHDNSNLSLGDLSSSHKKTGEEDSNYVERERSFNNSSNSSIEMNNKPLDDSFEVAVDAFDR